jgi:hypothetical protein
MNSIESILDKINRAERLDFGNILGESFELFKKTWIHGFILQLVLFIIMLPLIMVIYVPIFTVLIAQAKNGYAEPDAFSGIFVGMSFFYILFMIVAIFALSAIQFALNAGFFRMMKKLDFGEPVQTSDLFFFFKTSYFSKTFLLVLASVGIAIIAALLCYLPIFYVMVPLTYFGFIFAFNPELSVNDIIKISFKLGNKKWLISFGLMIVASLMSQIVGLILCGIGVLFTAAFVYHPFYLVYKSVVGFENETTP